MIPDCTCLYGAGRLCLGGPLVLVLKVHDPYCPIRAHRVCSTWPSGGVPLL